jgi:hypothetical protein
MLKKIKPKGWRKEVRDVKRWIKTFDQMEDLNHLDKDWCVNPSSAVIKSKLRWPNKAFIIQRAKKERKS